MFCSMHEFISKTLFTFSLALVLKVKILDISTFEKCERILDITKHLRNAERFEK